eukprot:gene10473-2603_t
MGALTTVAEMLLGKETLDEINQLTKRQLLNQVLNAGMVIFSALMIWKGLMVLTGSESPIVVVLSGSMEPAFSRGDLLFLTNFKNDPIRVGEILVFKGDNNRVDDRGLYAEVSLSGRYQSKNTANAGQLWLTPDDVVGRARTFIPHVGIVTIIMNDYPLLKVVLLGVLGLFMLIHRE